MRATLQLLQEGAACCWVEVGMIIQVLAALTVMKAIADEAKALHVEQPCLHGSCRWGPGMLLMLLLLPRAAAHSVVICAQARDLYLNSSVKD